MEKSIENNVDMGIDSYMREVFGMQEVDIVNIRLSHLHISETVFMILSSKVLSLTKETNKFRNCIRRQAVLYRHLRSRK